VALLGLWGLDASLVLPAFSDMSALMRERMRLRFIQMRTPHSSNAFVRFSMWRVRCIAGDRHLVARLMRQTIQMVLVGVDRLPQNAQMGHGHP